jgi:Putative zincin peptidase
VFIPGWLIALVTFPGVVVHEAAHRFFCDLTDTPVYEVSYFRPMSNPAGYVVHGRPRSLGAALLISGGPLLINTLLCAVLTATVAYKHFVLEAPLNNLVLLFLAWLGYSIGMHAFPSRQDAATFTAQVKDARGAGPTLLLAHCLSALVTLANALRIIGFNLFYAIGVSLAIPLLLGGF